MLRSHERRLRPRETLIRESEALAERFGSELWLSASWEFGGHVEVMAGDPAAAERSFRKEYELHRRMGDDAHASTSAAYLAVALCSSGPVRRGGGARDDRPHHRRRRRPGDAGERPLRPGAGPIRPRRARGGGPAGPGGRRHVRRGAEPLVPRGLPDDARGGLTRGRRARGRGGSGERRVGGVRAQGAPSRGRRRHER